MKAEVLSSPELENLAGLNDYLEFLFDKNKELNLIARTLTKDIFWEEMIVDSLYIKEFLPVGSMVLDIGSGGGVPVIPLAVERPDCQFFAVDSISKKCQFLEEVKVRLALASLNIINDRVENIALVKKGQFLVGTAKAVAELPVLLEYFAPLIERGGQLFLFKGRAYQEELKRSSHALAETGFTLSNLYTYSLAGKPRYILRFYKENLSLAKFPRAVGEAKKNPL